MRLKIISICLFFFTIFLSCKKEDLSNASGPNNSYAPVLSKVLINNQSAYEYLYNDSGMIWEEKSKFNFTMHKYNAKGQLISSKYYGNDDILSTDALVSEKAISATTWVTLATGNEDGTVTYEYNDNGQLLKSTATRPSSTSSEYSAFTYDADNRINRQTMYWDNAATGYIDYEYDKKGNLTSESLYNLPASGTAELITVTQYTFDNQANPFRTLSKLQIPGTNTNTNNILKETTTMQVSADQGSNKVMVTENSYKYNAMGYPTSQNDNITYSY